MSMIALHTFCMYAAGVTSSWVNEEYILKEDLFRYYDPTVRPRHSFIGRIDVQLELALHHIIDIDEKKQLLTASYFLRMYWWDEFLQWNRTRHKSIEELRTHASYVWYPDITFYNTVLSGRYLRAFKDFLVQVNSDGSVTWTVPVIMTTVCEYEVRDFPYDQQTCQIRVGSWTHKQDELYVAPATLHDVEIGNNSRNVEWLIVSYTARPANLTPTTEGVEFTLVLQREPGFYMVYLYMPAAVCLFASVFAFALKPYSESRVSLAVAGVLAQTVFLLLIMELLPADSTNPPLMSQFLSAILMMDSGIVVVSTVLTRVHSDFEWKTKPAPELYVTICRRLARILFISHASIGKIMHHRQQQQQQQQQTQWQPHQLKTTQEIGLTEGPSTSETKHMKGKKQSDVLINLLDKLKYFYESDLKEIADTEERKNIVEEWQLLVLVLDRIIFVSCLLTMIVATVWFVTIAPHSHIYSS